MRHLLEVEVEDAPGVLARIAALFARRAYNIAALVVGPAREGVSSIFIVVESDSHLTQVIDQVGKLVEVLSVTEREEAGGLQREDLIGWVKSAGQGLTD